MPKETSAAQHNHYESNCSVRNKLNCSYLSMIEKKSTETFDVHYDRSIGPLTSTFLEKSSHIMTSVRKRIPTASITANCNMLMDLAEMAKISDTFIVYDNSRSVITGGKEVDSAKSESTFTLTPMSLHSKSSLCKTNQVCDRPSPSTANLKHNIGRDVAQAKKNRTHQLITKKRRSLRKIRNQLKCYKTLRENGKLETIAVL